MFGVTSGIETYCDDMKKETCSCRSETCLGYLVVMSSHVYGTLRKKPKDYVVEYYRYDHVLV